MNRRTGDPHPPGPMESLMPTVPAPPRAATAPSDDRALPPAGAATDPPDVRALPSAGEATAHTLLNCLVREVCGPGHHTAVDGGRLLLRLPASGTRLRVAVHRTGLLGDHRCAGPVQAAGPDGWRDVDWRELGTLVAAELTARTGVSNPEFPGQLASSHTGMAIGLAARAHRTREDGATEDGAIRSADGPRPTADGPRPAAVDTHPAEAANRPAADGLTPAEDAHPADGPTPVEDTRPAERANRRAAYRRYLASERSLLFGHRFHPAPKARGADRRAWTAWAPETSAAFPLRLLAVREDRVAQECAAPGGWDALERPAAGLAVPDGYRVLPAHPWQYGLLRDVPRLREALAAGEVLDLGAGGPLFAPTASVRTLWGDGGFLKFSLNVRITNCLRKNASYELSGAVALTRSLGGVFDGLAARYPGAAVLREPAYRSLALPGPDGRPDRSLLEGFGVIVREGFDGLLRPGVTPLLAAAVADPYATGPTLPVRTAAGRSPAAALDWWGRYLRLLLPPVLSAFTEHGVVLEPHLQNVLIGVDGDGLPVQVLFRDLEGTKLLADRHRDLLAALPPEVAGPLAYDEPRGWDRVVYCLLVNNAAEILAVLADRHPDLEAALWAEVRDVLREFAAGAERPGRVGELLAGAPLPAKANLLTRWARDPDREAGYVRLPSPLTADVLPEATR
ncbi:IucA/IucC family protein [Streptantibioticus silvisoli]|uniref:IucA/IucC family protein n=1 Tax=Streptantibioticus silvisoli TaxID=2705255 RepID=A0ABT6WAM5_9ACTN|nr:IucA/IucC family protein [Streptantibioticus silvisoli]MDI5967531.1 IucA/IucC family protein [Streptantibioticus silvisoli]